MGAVGRPGVKTRAQMAETTKVKDWEQTNVLYAFDDGWMICLDETEADIKRNATETRTCVSGGHITARLITGPDHRMQQEDLEAAKAKIRERIKSYYPNFTDKQIDYEVANEMRYGGTKEPVYRLGHVRNAEGKAVSTILFIHEKVYAKDWKGGYVSYSSSADLGTKKYIKLPDGEKYRIAEVRYGEEGVKRVTEWFKKATRQKIEGNPRNLNW